MGVGEGECPSTVDDQAYEPTYAEAFPPLPCQPGEGEDLVAVAPAKQQPWAASNRGMSLRQSTVTQVSSCWTEYSVNCHSLSWTNLDV